MTPSYHPHGEHKNRKKSFDCIFQGGKSPNILRIRPPPKKMLEYIENLGCPNVSNVSGTSLDVWGRPKTFEGGPTFRRSSLLEKNEISPKFWGHIQI